MKALLFHHFGTYLKDPFFPYYSLHASPTSPPSPRHIIIDIVEALAWRWPIKPIFLNYVLQLEFVIELLSAPG